MFKGVTPQFEANKIGNVDAGTIVYLKIPAFETLKPYMIVDTKSGSKGQSQIVALFPNWLLETEFPASRTVLCLESDWRIQFETETLRKEEHPHNAPFGSVGLMGSKPILCARAKSTPDIPEATIDLSTGHLETPAASGNELFVGNWRIEYCGTTGNDWTTLIHGEPAENPDDDPD